MKKLCAVTLLAGVILLPTACAKKPPTVSPVAYTAQQAISGLEILKAAAVAANGQKLVSDANLALLEQYITAAEAVIKQAPAGWQATIVAGLDQLQTVLPVKEYAQIDKYVEAAKIIIQLAK